MEIEVNELNIYELENFYKILNKEYKNSGSIFELDFKNVEKIDFVAIQLLISLQKTAKKEDKKLNFTNINESILQKLKKCKIDSILGLSNV